MLSKIFFIGIVFIQTMLFSHAAIDVRKDILPISKTASGKTISDDLEQSGTNLLDNMFAFITNSIFGLLVLISIGMFLYIGFKLLTANGNPEELKKTFVTLTYVIIGLAVVAVSWLAISLISGISL